MKAENWVEKYAPKTLSDVAGNQFAVKDLREWAQSWLKGIPENRAIILHGRSGTGKTSS